MASRRIFLAHAREDKPQIRKLYADLKAKGFDPWLDEEDLLAGQIWKQEIPKAIKGADIFLACLSSRSIEKKGYVQKEFRTALAAMAELPPGSIFLLPVRLDECDIPDLQIPDQGLSLRDIHWVDLWQDRGFDRLLKSLGQVIDTGDAKKEGRTTDERQTKQKLDWAPEMVVIPAGTFLMGSPEDEEGRYEIEGPQHKVTIGRSFELGRYAVTFDEYDYFCDRTGRKKPGDWDWGRDRRPVINVSWNHATAYTKWLSEETGETYHLPSEAEWEYACRAGTTSRYSWGDVIDPDKTNYRESGYGKTVEVGHYPANLLGLQEMHGNVLEWCEDVWHETYEGSPTDGSVWLEGGDQDRRVLRGGSWCLNSRSLRSAYRYRSFANNWYDDVGFRVARTIR